MGTTVFIDLGDDWSVAEDSGTRRRPGTRLLLAGAVGLLALLLPTAAQAPGPAFVRVATIPAPGTVAVEAGPDALFLGEQTPDGGRFVSRYSISTGVKAWGTSVENAPQDIAYLAAAGVAAVSSYDPQANQSRLSVLDSGTGRLLWRSLGYLLWVGPSGTGTGQDAVLIVGDPDGPRQLQVVDPRSGRPRWTRQLPVSADVLLTASEPSQTTDVLVVERDGTATVLGGDGATLATATLPGMARSDSTDATGQTNVNVVDGRLVVQRGTDGVTVLTSYDLPGLEQRWQRSGQFDGYPSDCGRVLCVGESGGLAALDPDDGTQRWDIPAWQGASLIEGDRLLGYRIGEGEHSGVLDARTGRLLVELDGWSPLQDFATSRLATAFDTSSYRYTMFGRLDPDARRVQPIARLAGIGSRSCQLDADLLICGTSEATVAIWRYRP